MGRELDRGECSSHWCVEEARWKVGIAKGVPSRLQIVFRHYPRSASHPHAQQAADAAEAAAQVKFWEMHSLLFERQEAPQTKDLIRYAGELGLDADDSAQIKELAVRT